MVEVMIEHVVVIDMFRASIRALYGPRIERLVLYGSRARGDAGPDSDYDIAVFLNDLDDLWREGRRIADIEVAVLDHTGAIVQTLPFPAGSWHDQSSPLMTQIRQDGLDL